MNVDHANEHGSFLPEEAPIRMSNLCCEIDLPTKPLQSSSDTEGEISLCTLSAINWGLIDDKKDFKKLVLENDNFGPEIEDFFKPEMAIRRRITPGSTGLEAVEVQKELIEKRLETQTSMISR